MHSLLTLGLRIFKDRHCYGFTPASYEKRVCKTIFCHGVDVVHRKYTVIPSQVVGIPKMALIQTKVCVCVVGEVVNRKTGPNICSGFAII